MILSMFDDVAFSTVEKCHDQSVRTIVAAMLACAACCAQPVTIVNSGSTNTAGFRIVVEQSGQAEYTAQPRSFPARQSGTPKPIGKTIPKSLAKTLYADVDAAKPLSSLPAPRCAKSASFGTRLTVQAGDDTSPDLNCGDGGDERLRALIRDVDAVINIFQEH